MAEYIEKDRSTDGVNRRGFLKCMAWAGAGMVWVMKDGVLRSQALGATPAAAGAAAGAGAGAGAGAAARADFTFAQVSDSHIGFSKGVYADVVGTFELAVSRLNALPQAPSLVLHTGDLTHLSKPKEFDTVAQVMKSARTEKVFYVPGEHDSFVDDGKEYRERFGKGTLGTGWHSFDYKGVHFIGLVNVANLTNGKSALGALGKDQLAWMKKDLADRGSSTPVVVFAHVPLWAIYPEWGWGTEDAAEALGYLRRFGSVSILNGHIHQVVQKVEGKMTFHTARSTAFPQPEAGKAESPGPMKNVAAEKLRSMLGLTRVNYVENGGDLALVDSTLE